MIILQVSGYLHPLKTISKVVSRYFITNKWNLSVSRGRLIGVVHSIIHVKSDDDCFAFSYGTKVAVLAKTPKQSSFSDFLGFSFETVNYMSHHRITADDYKN